jgi:hypothetical protein
MIDYFSLALTHGLLAIALWRLLWRADLDADPDVAETGVEREDAAPRA